MVFFATSTGQYPFELTSICSVRSMPVGVDYQCGHCHNLLFISYELFKMYYPLIVNKCKTYTTCICFNHSSFFLLNFDTIEFEPNQIIKHQLSINITRYRNTKQSMFLTVASHVNNG